MRPSCLVPFLAATALLALCGVQSPAQGADALEIQRAQRHQTEEWRLLEPHLPDLQRASPQLLQLEGDILRARRFEEDALDYYRAALLRGGDEGTLMNRIGVTDLVLHQPELARASFRRALELRPRDAQVWNNLGAPEYFMGNYRAALTDYLRAAKLDGKSALVRSNLGGAYFEIKDYESAARQFGLAFRLDPHVFDQSTAGGVETHVLTATERGHYCFELARVAATLHRDASVMEWLGKALDVNFDIHAEMQKYAIFDPYLQDPRVRLLIQNSRAMHGRRLASNAPLPPLSEDRPN